MLDFVEWSKQVKNVSVHFCVLYRTLLDTQIVPPIGRKPKNSILSI